MMRMVLLPRQETRTRQAQRQIQRCFACRQDVDSSARIEAAAESRIALARRAGVCPACGTATLDADDDAAWAEVARRARALWSGKVAEALRPTPHLPLYRQGVVGCPPAACPPRPKAPF